MGAMYPEFFVAPMRAELTRFGVEELRIGGRRRRRRFANTAGTLMIVVNSVCGCAAGKARPGVALALRHATRPDRVATVFAGADVEATNRAREYFTGVAPVFAVGRASCATASWSTCWSGTTSRTGPPSRLPTELTAAFDRSAAPPTAADSRRPRAEWPSSGLAASRVHLEVRILSQRSQRHERRADRRAPGGPRRRDRLAPATRWR